MAPPLFYEIPSPIQNTIITILGLSEIRQMIRDNLYETDEIYDFLIDIHMIAFEESRPYTNAKARINRFSDNHILKQILLDYLKKLIPKHRRMKSKETKLVKKEKKAREEFKKKQLEQEKKRKEIAKAKIEKQKGRKKNLFCNNPSDPLSLEDMEDIPTEELVKLHYNKKIYCYDNMSIIQTLKPGRAEQGYINMEGVKFFRLNVGFDFFFTMEVSKKLLNLMKNNSHFRVIKTNNKIKLGFHYSDLYDFKQMTKSEIESSLKLNKPKSISKKPKSISKKPKSISKKPKKIVKKKGKKSKKSKGGVKEDCMSYSVAKIKKSAEYKALPRSVGKSKLNKKELCEVIKRH